MTKLNRMSRLQKNLEENAENRFFEPGQQILIEGQQAHEAYFIKRGQVSVYRVRNEKEKIIAYVGEGDILGEMAIMRFDTYTMSARAIEETEVYVISPQFIQEQLMQTPPLIKATLSMLLDRMNDVNETLIDLDET